MPAPRFNFGNGNKRQKEDKKKVAKCLITTKLRPQTAVAVENPASH